MLPDAPAASPSSLIGAALDSTGLGATFLRMSVKEAAHAAIDAMPEQATLQDAADRLALLAALEKGRQAVREGRWKSQEDVEKLLPSWLEK
jgi:hypothetical protein